MDAYLAAADEGGTRIFITTREALVASDTDSSLDIYERSGGVDHADLDRPQRRQRATRAPS